MSLEKKITAIHADANALPFEQDSLMQLSGVDAYLYFGLQAGFMEEKLAPLLKVAGEIALASPRLQTGAVLATAARVSTLLESGRSRTFP